MKLALTAARTYNGFTYAEGEHEVDDVTAAAMLKRFTVVCRPAAPPKVDVKASTVVSEAVPEKEAVVEPVTPETSEPVVVAPKKPTTRKRRTKRTSAKASSDK